MPAHGIRQPARLDQIQIKRQTPQRRHPARRQLCFVLERKKSLCHPQITPLVLGHCPQTSKRGKTPGQSGCDGRFSDEVRERRDLVRTGDQEAIAEITPEGDAELVACLHQREEGVPTVPAELGACAGTDLAPGNLAADVVFGAIGMERDLGALQDLQKIIFLGVEAREQPIQADEACAGAEDALEAPPQLGPAPWRRITAVSLEVGIEPPDTLADALQGLALPVAEALELVYQTFGMDPALGVLAEPELTGTVTEDDGVGE